MPEDTLHIRFLNKTFDLPKDIVTFLNEHHQFERMRHELLTRMMADYRDLKNFPGEYEAHQIFSNYADVVVKKLISKGIYDVTVEDLIGPPPSKDTPIKDYISAAKNRGMRLFYESIKNALMEEINALLNQMTNFMGQAEQADRERAAKITGTGLNIISNDIIGFGVWAAMERSELKRQERSANADFQSKIDESIKSGNEEYERSISERDKKWIVDLETSINLYFIELYDKYIDVMVSRRKFCADALNYIDIRKSESIIRNIDAAEDKHGIIESAFLTCPFCVNVYCIALPFCDASETLECAKVFGVGEYLINFAEEECESILSCCDCDIPEASERIFPYAELLSIANSESLDTIVKKIFKKKKSEKEELLRRLTEEIASASDAQLKHKIPLFLSISTHLSAFDLDNAEMQRRIRAYLKKQISADTDVHHLYDEILDRYAEEILLPVICAYIQRAKSEHIEYQRKKQEYEMERNRIQEDLSECKAMQSSLGIFNFSKKKELQKRIDALHISMSALEEAMSSLHEEYRNGRPAKGSH